MAEIILVIDDDSLLLRLVKRTLEQDGYSVFTARTGEEGLALFDQVGADLVIVDIMMPGMDGWEVCRRLRKSSCVPILVLSALAADVHVVSGLTVGADDYQVKPLMGRELRARVAALLRRARMPRYQSDVLRFNDGDLVINRAEQSVDAHGKEVSLSPIEYNLLLYMAERAGRILPRSFLFSAIWGPTADTSPQSLKWYIWRLRQKIELKPADPQLILTEPGRGYRFSPQ